MPEAKDEDVRKDDQTPQTTRTEGSEDDDPKPHQGGHGTLVAGEEVHKAEYDEDADKGSD